MSQSFKKPKDIRRFQAELIEKQYRRTISPAHHNAINSSCQIILKTFELDANLERLEELEELAKSLSANPAQLEEVKEKISKAKRKLNKVKREVKKNQKRQKLAKDSEK